MPKIIRLSYYKFEELSKKSQKIAIADNRSKSKPDEEVVKHRFEHLKGRIANGIVRSDDFDPVLTYWELQFATFNNHKCPKFNFITKFGPEIIDYAKKVSDIDITNEERRVTYSTAYNKFAIENDNEDSSYWVGFATGYIGDTIKRFENELEELSKLYQEDDYVAIYLRHSGILFRANGSRCSKLELEILNQRS